MAPLRPPPQPMSMPDDRYSEYCPNPHCRKKFPSGGRIMNHIKSRYKPECLAYYDEQLRLSWEKFREKWAREESTENLSGNTSVDPPGKDDRSGNASGNASSNSYKDASSPQVQGAFDAQLKVYKVAIERARQRREEIRTHYKSLYHQIEEIKSSIEQYQLNLEQHEEDLDLIQDGEDLNRAAINVHVTSAHFEIAKLELQRQTLLTSRADAQAEYRSSCAAVRDLKQQYDGARKLSLGRPKSAGQVLHHRSPLREVHNSSVAKASRLSACSR